MTNDLIGETWEWDNLLPHIEDDLRMEKLTIQHFVDGCQCEGRTCTRCEILKCYAAFSPEKRTKLGLQSRCRQCDSAMYYERKANPKPKRQRYDLQTRFAEYVDMFPGNCWIWKGPFDKDGYGTLKVNRRHTRAHRISYELFVGAIPEGLVIDHLCSVRACVNPEHLEAVTKEMNSSRGARRHFKEQTAWITLYRDLYRQVYGDQASEQEWKHDAEKRKQKLGL